MRHVAVVAETSTRLGRVVGVLFEPRGKVGMTLQASLISTHALGQLLIGIALVHRMAGQAGELIGLVAGCFDQTQVLGAAHTTLNIF